MSAHVAPTQETPEAAVSAPAPAGLVPRLQRVTKTGAGLVAALGAMLFVVGAAPLMFVSTPPLQDLPNHMASATVMLHPQAFPDFVFNGFFKTNTALFAWLAAFGPLLGMPLAAKTFTLLTLGAMAWSIPAFVLALGGRRRAVIATFFAWPMIHNWFVSMGMLDFALGVAFSLMILTLIRYQLDRFTAARAAAIAVLAAMTWFTHVFPLLVLGMLLLVEIAQNLVRRERTVRVWVPVVLALAPAALLSVVSVFIHFIEPRGEMTGYIGRTSHPYSWQLLYNLWAEWMWSFTKLSLGSLVPCVGLFLCGVLFRKMRPMFFSWPAMLALGLAYMLVPNEMTNWYSFNSRFVAYLWFGLLLRVPEKLDGRLKSVLGISAASYVVGNCVDYVRLDREIREFTSAIDRVPMRARLLPLVFRGKATSENTLNLLHAWGHYVVQRHTSAPLLFAHSRAFPVMYREAPPVRLNHLQIENFTSLMGSPEVLCRELAPRGFQPSECGTIYSDRWRSFFEDATPVFSHLLFWDAPAIPPHMPPAYRLVHREGRLSVYERPIL